MRRVNVCMGWDANPATGVPLAICQDTAHLRRIHGSDETGRYLCSLIAALTIARTALRKSTRLLIAQNPSNQTASWAASSIASDGLRIDLVSPPRKNVTQWPPGGAGHRPPQASIDPQLVLLL